MVFQNVPNLARSARVSCGSHSAFSASAREKNTWFTRDFSLQPKSREVLFREQLNETCLAHTSVLTAPDKNSYNKYQQSQFTQSTCLHRLHRCLLSLPSLTNFLQRLFGEGALAGARTFAFAERMQRNA